MSAQKLVDKQVGQSENRNGSTEANQQAIPVLPIQVPPVSGLYLAAASPLVAVFEQLRLDVDGAYPQMVASGTIRRNGFSNSAIHWIANVTADGIKKWSGPIWYKDNDGTPVAFPLPYTDVTIQVSGSGNFNPYTATVTFSGGGSTDRVSTLLNRSPWFRQVEFEFDTADGTTAVTSVQSHGHPNRPATLPNQNLTIEEVFSRVGFEVKKSNGDSIVPLLGAGTDALWSDSEMHDAMQTYWSRFANTAQWSMWTFFAWQHVAVPSDGITSDGLGGIMFDDIGQNHRQGTAIFNGSFIQNAPVGDLAPDAWVERMRFWTAVHEMGHSFNLAHSWRKADPGGWIGLSNRPEARSFMNYPYRVNGGQTAFFADFDYRFSDEELLFMRHAPERFVQMGNADWYDHHAFQQAILSPEPRFKIEVRVNREKPLFEFMEPIVLEVKLTNIADEPQLVHESLLSYLDEMTLIIKRNNQPARQFLPYAQYCFMHRNKVLMPNESAYASLFISAGRGGWNIDEPGNYTIQMALHLGDEDVVSNRIILRVAPPLGYDEAFMAQELFTDDVGRILAFDGSQYFANGNDVFREITEKLGDRAIAIHAHVALAMPLTREQKQLILPTDMQDALQSVVELGGKIKVKPPQIDEARKELSKASIGQSALSAQTLGHIDTKSYVDRFSQSLADHGENKEAAQAQEAMHRTFASRKVLPKVLAEIQSRSESYSAMAAQPKGKKK